MNSTKALSELHTAAIDAKAGYEEAFEKAEAIDLKALLCKVADLHGRHARDLAALLMQRGEKPDPDSSLMGTVHTTILDVRALFGKLDKSIIPGLIDGEERNIQKYDNALISAFPGGNVVIESQRQELRKLVNSLKTESMSSGA